MSIEQRFNDFVSSLSPDEQRDAMRLMVRHIREAAEAPAPDNRRSDSMYDYALHRHMRGFGRRR